MNMETERIPMEELLPVLLLQMEQGGSAWLTVTGSSMNPTFRHGRDRVELVRRAPREGDVVLYQRTDGAYILHRIVGSRDGAWLCSGDNQWELECVGREQMIACVQSFIRKGKAHSITEKPYRFWTGLWTGLAPVRKPIIKLRRVCGRIRRTWRKKK